LLFTALDVIAVVRSAGRSPPAAAIEENTAMATDRDGSHASVPVGNMESRLERGEVVFFPNSPFALPTATNLTLLLETQLAHLAKNVSCNPSTGKLSGFVRGDADRESRLRSIFMEFSRSVTEWVGRALPRYRGGCQLDDMSYRPLEEATRTLRQKARNDLLHVDAFPSRPAVDRRILRVFVNLNPKEPRIWVTSEPFAKLLTRYGQACGLPGKHSAGWLDQVRNGIRGVFRSAVRRRTVCDSFMLRFHDFLKANDEFQERAPKKLWTFPPGSVWVAMTDACSHAVLRGRYALEHSYFVDPSVLVVPDEAPAALLRRACNPHVVSQVPRRAA
jgi:3-deoxy-D-manno-oct-2-ulosonic acid (Kdo) hydroxylase